jgi:hypothetical protein
VHRLSLAVVASLALTASACATPSKEKSSVDGERAGTAAEDEDGKAKAKQPWWKLSQYSREPKEKPWIYGDIRPGKGLLSNDEDGFVLHRQGEGDSSDPNKPTKVRR